MLFIL